MIFGGLILTAFLIFLSIRIAKLIKEKKPAYKSVEEKRGAAGSAAHLLDGLKASKAQPEPFPEQTVHVQKELVPEEIETQEKSVLNAESGLDKINRLPELQKAVVWAELLGKPRSERKL